MALTCDRCGRKATPSVHGLPRSAMAEGWSSFEVLRADGETMDLLVICPACLTEAEEHGGWPVPSPPVSEEERI